MIIPFLSTIFILVQIMLKINTPSIYFRWPMSKLLVYLHSKPSKVHKFEWGEEMKKTADGKGHSDGVADQQKVKHGSHMGY